MDGVVTFFRGRGLALWVMNFLSHKSCAEEGDTAIVYLTFANIYAIKLARGEVFQTKFGALKHDDVIGRKYGTKVKCSRGYVYVLFATPELWTLTLPHRTQILYTRDISFVTLQLDLKPGSVVCEAGECYSHAPIPQCLGNKTCDRPLILTPFYSASGNILRNEN